MFACWESSGTCPDLVCCRTFKACLRDMARKAVSFLGIACPGPRDALCLKIDMVSSCWYTAPEGPDSVRARKTCRSCKNKPRLRLRWKDKWFAERLWSPDQLRWYLRSSELAETERWKSVELVSTELQPWRFWNSFQKWTEFRQRTFVSRWDLVIV